VPKPLLLGHRGARACVELAENTIPSFDLALQHGCDGFEFDVRLSHDGRPVICHDPEIRGLSISQTNAADLAVSQLNDILARYANSAFLDIELKVSGLESELLVALKQNPPQKGYFVSSFIAEVISNLRCRDGQIPLGFICDRRKELEAWHDLPIQFLVPHHSLVTRGLVEEVHEKGLALLTWTVNDAGSMLRLADWGTDGIISDKTELLVRTLAARRDC